MESLIAATARHHGLILVTRDIGDLRHFAQLAVEAVAVNAEPKASARGDFRPLLTSP